MNNKTYPENQFNFCPRCGSGEFHRQETNSTKCKKCGFHYFHNVSTAVMGLIKNHRKELMLVRRAIEPAKGLFDLPGGFMMRMETAEEALKREVKEELNLDILTLSYFTSHPNEYLYEGISVFTLDIAFECVVDDFSGITSKDDITEYCFFAPDKMDLESIGLKSPKKVVQMYLDKYN